ncbi:MFS transporter [Humibacillus xanthopallidus]|uniref:EmrB/QacA subfamily drug resistance transporter n=1 Tax=Humibacillus xanthopallidus TaxID=412689 RepID=A0A543HX39_9MICO|nr:MFS transporter [Humibacillus xanthopallidus]TQM62933.1 EmrB/QacA subfamily drug resistance transporter [Humibacillus xanthopallidus]
MTDDRRTHVVDDAHPAAQDEPPDPRRWRALAVCLVAGFMTLLDVSIVNVALPSIQQGVGASPSDLQWIVSGYALAFGLTLVGAGRVGDIVGRRPVFIAGVVLFGAASLACGLASSSAVLVVARLVQGAAGGILNPQVSGLIQQMFSGRERGRAFGMLGATIGISTAVGPIVGGLIINALGPDAGWRWIFFVNLPIAVVAVILARRWLPAPRRARSARLDLDPVGVVLLGGTVLALLLPLVETGRGSGPSGSRSGAIPWWVAMIGLVLAAAFIAWERSYTRRGRSPLVDLDLFRVPGYSPGATVGLIYFGGFTGIFFVLTIYFQDALGYSPLLAGLAVTPFAAGSAVAAAIGGYLVGRFGRLLVTAGLTTVLVGLVVVDLVLAHVSGPQLGWALLVPLLVAGLGSGLVISPNVTLTLAAVPVKRAGTAGGLLQTGQRIGTAAGIALIGAVYFAVSATHDSTRGAVWALRVAAGLVAVALLASGLDLRSRRRQPQPTRDDEDEAAGDATGDGEGVATGP